MAYVTRGQIQSCLEGYKTNKPSRLKNIYFSSYSRNILRCHSSVTGCHLLGPLYFLCSFSLSKACIDLSRLTTFSHSTIFSWISLFTSFSSTQSLVLSNTNWKVNSLEHTCNNIIKCNCFYDDKRINELLNLYIWVLLISL